MIRQNTTQRCSNKEVIPHGSGAERPRSPRRPPSWLVCCDLHHLHVMERKWSLVSFPFCKEPDLIMELTLSQTHLNAIISRRTPPDSITSKFRASAYEQSEHDTVTLTWPLFLVNWQKGKDVGLCKMIWMSFSQSEAKSPRFCLATERQSLKRKP